MPEAELIHLRSADAGRVVPLSYEVGWEHPLVLWEQLLEWSGAGSFGLTVDGRLVAVGLIICYGDRRAWVAALLTSPDYQRRGLGARMMAVLMDHARARGIGEILLDSSDVGKPLYEKLGFQPLPYEVEIWAGTAPSVRPASHIRRFVPADLPGIIALDAATFGVERGWLIEQLVAFSHNVWVDGLPGYVRGFVCAGFLGERVRIGPCSHRDPGGAKALMQTAFHAVAGRPANVVISNGNPAAVALADELGLEERLPAARMIHGGSPTPQEQAASCFATLSAATG